MSATPDDSNPRSRSVKGAEPAHYDAVGTTLLTTMIEFGGAQWTPDYSRAWNEGFRLIRDTMLEGASELAANAGS